MIPPAGSASVFTLVGRGMPEAARPLDERSVPAMPDDLTRAALQTLSDLKRAGVIPTIRPCCGQDYCVCDHAPHLPSLRDHAEDPDAYDRAIDAPIRLKVVTAGPPVGPPCDGGMCCPCQRCQIQRSKLKPRGAGPAAFAVRTRRAA